MTVRAINQSAALRHCTGFCLAAIAGLGMPAGAVHAQAMDSGALPPANTMPAPVPGDGDALQTAGEAPDNQLPAYLRQSAPDNVPDDPWEHYNRRVFRFNRKLDKAVVVPVARTYVRIVPSPIRNRVASFFQNVQQVPTALNLLLQGKPAASATAAGRFAVNTTIGIAGLFDPATHLHIPHYRDDFGRTMAGWGWRDSRYFLLPLLGPGTLRDDVGRLVDSQAGLIAYVRPLAAQGALVGASALDVRSRALVLDDLTTGVDDEYVLVRDAWSQHRQYEIEQSGPDQGATQSR